MNFVPLRDFDEEIAAERRDEDHRRNAIYTAEEAEALISAAREEGRLLGRREGEEIAHGRLMEEASARTIAALDAVAPAVRELVEASDTLRATLESQLLDFVVSVFERVLPDLMTSEAGPRAEAEMGRAIRMALGSSKLALRLPAETVAAKGSDLEDRIRAAGFDGRVEILADPTLAPGDVRAVWDNGFMDSSYAGVCSRILAALKTTASDKRAALTERADEKRAVK